MQDEAPVVGAAARSPWVLVASASEDWLGRVRSALDDTAWKVRCLRTSKELIDALGTLQEERSALVVLDACLDDATGLAVCRRIRESEALGRTPVLFVSRYASELDRVLCFENGADDFVADPFFGRELISRSQAVWRRDMRQGRSEQELSEARFGDVTLDLRRGRVELEGRPVDLTARELDVLRALVQQAGRVVRREELLRNLDSEGERTLRVIDTHVKALRRKLGPAREHIQTVRGVGYRFDAEL